MVGKKLQHGCSGMTVNGQSLCCIIRKFGPHLECIIQYQRTLRVSDIGTDVWIKVLSLLQFFQKKMHDVCTPVLVNKLGFRGLFCKHFVYKSSVAPVCTKFNYTYSTVHISYSAMYLTIYS